MGGAGNLIDYRGKVVKYIKEGEQLKKGYFGIGIENIKVESNIGTLWRSAYILGADFIFTINKRYNKQCTDTVKCPRHIPLFHYKDFDDFYGHMPYDCMLVGVELDINSRPIKNFIHPDRCIYLLGAEDHGLTRKAIDACHVLVQLPGDYCMNVSTAGSIVMYDRQIKST